MSDDNLFSGSKTSPPPDRYVLKTSNTYGIERDLAEVWRVAPKRDGVCLTLRTSDRSTLTYTVKYTALAELSRRVSTDTYVVFSGLYVPAAELWTALERANVLARLDEL